MVRLACSSPGRAWPAPARRLVAGLGIALTLGGSPAGAQGVPQGRPHYVPVGLFIGSIEEGARIFSPARLLPFEHPDALGHQFPTVLQLYGTEYELLLWLGEEAGYRLQPTLQRYPREPAPDWPYPEFTPPPGREALRAIVPQRLSSGSAPLAGLRAVLWSGDQLVAFIVDTRGLSLADRGMARATSMGLDLTRHEFLSALGEAARFAPGDGLRAVVFER